MPRFFSISFIALALVYFLWGAAQFILHGGDEGKRSEGTKMMIYGIIGLFVMVSVWSLVGVLENTFFRGGGDNSNAVHLEIDMGF